MLFVGFEFTLKPLMRGRSLTIYWVFGDVGDFGVLVLRFRV